LNNLNINMEKYKDVILYGVLILLVTFFCLSKLIPIIQQNISLNTQIRQTKTEIKTLEEKLNAIRNQYEKNTTPKTLSFKKIYSPKDINLDSSELFYDINNDLIEMAQLNGVKIQTIEYKDPPADDLFLKKEPTKYSVSEINMNLITDYLNFENFLRSIYKYPYYINIQNIEIVPYKNNPKIIIITLTLRLYAFSTPQDDNQKNKH